jgi:hypothetical protein
MKYYIQRQLNEYGPYTLADLQRYVAQGSIQLTDLTRSEGMTEWVPVSQVIGNIPAPQPPAVVQMPGSAMPGANVYGSGGTVYGGPVQVPGGVPVYGAPVVPGLIPPDFHWALVLLVNFFCNVFQIVWLFIEAGFVKKIDSESKGISFLAGSIVIEIVAVVVFFTSIAMSPDRQDPPASVFVPFILIALAGVVLHFIGVFQMRTSLQNYYNTVEPIHLRLSGVMTFFFAVYYFQYHFSRIANWKRTGYLEPQ